MKTSSRGLNLKNAIVQSWHKNKTQRWCCWWKPQSWEPLVLDSFIKDERHRATKLVVEEPQGFARLDVRVESCTVRTMHLISFWFTCVALLRNITLLHSEPFQWFVSSAPLKDWMVASLYGSLSPVYIVYSGRSSSKEEFFLRNRAKSVKGGASSVHCAAWNSGSSYLLIRGC